MSNNKLILKSNILHSINDASHVDLGELFFDKSQFKIPTSMVVQKEGINAKLEKEKNLNGELMETGKLRLTFKTFDLEFIKLVIQNGSTEIGSPITVIVEGQDNIPDLDVYEDGEFIPISFKNIKITPKKIQKKIFTGLGKPMTDAWVYDELKIQADAYTLGIDNETKK